MRQTLLRQHSATAFRLREAFGEEPGGCRKNGRFYDTSSRRSGGKGMFSRQDLTQKATLSDDDLAEVHRCRRNHNRLGFAYQMGFVKLLGRFPKQQPLEMIDELLVFTGVQLGIEAACIDRYQQRRETIAEHQEKIRSHLGLKRLEGQEVGTLEAFIFEEAFRFNQNAVLVARAREFLRERILLPAESTLARIVGRQRRRAQGQIFAKVMATTSDELACTLDDLLLVEPGQSVSALQSIKAQPNKPSVEAMLSVTSKLAVIEATGILAIDLCWLNSNLQRAMFHHVRKSSVDRLRRLAQPRRHAALVCFLWQSYRDTVDQAVDMFDKLLLKTHTRAQNELDEQMRSQRQKIRRSLATLKTLAEIILDDSVTNDELRSQVFEQVPKEELAARVEELEEWVSGKRSHLFHGIVRRYGNLRKFSPAFLKALEFVQDEGDKNVCLRALRILKEMNAAGRRKLPEDAPTDFVSRRLLPIVEPGAQIDRHAWECALLLKIRDEIKSGNLAVKHSKRFGRLDDFFIEASRWETMRKEFFGRATLPADPLEVPGYLSSRLGKAYDRFHKTSPDNSYATVNERGWHISTDSTEKLDQQAKKRLEQLKGWLSRHMRRVILPDILIEVDNELGFSRYFMTPAGRQKPSREEIRIILAAVLAHGCNIGTHTMDQLIQGISYKQLKRVSDWQLTQEAQRSALAALVDAIAALDTSLYWGEGKTSASDGQRFALPRKVLQQTYSLKFSDFALEFYTFVADNYAPFYSTPIECTDRDAAFVLDGLLYNESELELEEHYTDTHGYTEINFTAFVMLGRRFCPRIRGLSHQRIYRIDPDRDYGTLASLVARADRTIDTQVIAEQWDRMGHLYASLESGHVAASVALKRLAAYNAKNRFYRANRDLGRILKTEFILRYMSEPDLRNRIRRGLLKVDQLHAMARDVFYGRRGRINSRELWEQMNSCSCLTLLLACIVYWQAKEISRVFSQCDPVGSGIDLSLLEHISPIEWDNVVLYGQYFLDRERIAPRRPSA